MYWEIEESMKELKIRQRIEYHEKALQKKRQELSKLYDKVYARNKREGTVST